jgi:hypothetical protein
MTQVIPGDSRVFEACGCHPGISALDRNAPQLRPAAHRCAIMPHKKRAFLLNRHRVMADFHLGSERRIHVMIRIISTAPKKKNAPAKSTQAGTVR